MKSPFGNQTFEQWLAEHPPPDLQELVATFGNYSAVTPATWEAFDRRMAIWRKLYYTREHDR